MDVKKLKKSFQEIIDLIGLTDEKTGDPISIPKNANEEYLVEKIKDAIQYIEPTDKFSKDTEAILEALKEDEAPKPAKGKKKKEVEVEEEEEEIEDAEEVEETDEDEENEAEGNEELIAEVEDAETIKDLKAIAKEHDLFEDVNLKTKDIDELREEMLAAIEEAGGNTETEEEEEEIEEEPVKKTSKKAPAKKEESEPAAKKPVKKSPITKVVEETEEEEDEKPAKKAKKPAATEKKTTTPKEGQLESFQSIADRLLKEKATDKVINATFAKLYRDRKGITDTEFVAKRATIYMDIAKKKK
jgi:hypothetical protein